MTHASHATPLGIHVTTYADLEKIVQAFARGDLNLLILLGSHGLGKSRIVRHALPGPVCWLDSNVSIFGLYCQLWRHRHQPVVLDDLDGLYASRDGVRLLKCLTQSEPVKRVSWHSDAPTLARVGGMDLDPLAADQDQSGPKEHPPQAAAFHPGIRVPRNPGRD